MSKDDQNNPMAMKLNKEVRAIGRHLNKLMKQMLEALETLDVELALDLLPKLEKLQIQEYASREICLEILALAKGNNTELEWIKCSHKVLILMGKSSLEIAEIAGKISEIKNSPNLPLGKDLPSMGKIASRMLNKSLDTVFKPDVDKALKVMASDSSLDQCKQNFTEKAVLLMMENPESLYPVVPYLHVSRHLEKIGDNASHIAEEVAYFLKEQSN